MKKIIAIFSLLFIVLAIVSCDVTTTTQTTTQASLETTTQTTTQTSTDTNTSSTTLETTTQTTYLTTTDALTTLVSYTSIEVTAQYDQFFYIGEAFDKSSIQLTANLSDGTSMVITSDLFNIRGFDSSSSGLKTFYVIYEQFVTEVEVYILEDFAFPLEMSYYEDAINLKGAQLKVALNTIINEGFIPLLYGDARDILQESDADPEIPGNIILVYTGNSVKSDWDGGLTWNREHTWPQSRLGVYVAYGDDDFPSRATDIHNLKPADPDENANRSNDYFDTFEAADIYVPREEVRGDIARILFYMAIMYTDMSLNDDKASNVALRTMGMLSTLLEWNESDPVDDFERNRNDVLYSYQGNRNPFIDYPEFAELIWSESAS